jgi:hypothetical protein
MAAKMTLSRNPPYMRQAIDEFLVRQDKRKKKRLS